jgi:alpha-ketoglutarate-dependent taurine dioxygenase
VVANMFGDPLVQNAEGDRVIAVYARPGNRRVIDGARYHQSREGGGPHTDNVSLPDPWEYLVFSCIHAAAVGGESILIDGFAIHQALQDVPDALQVLERPFWWEYRGLGDGLFEAPIVTYDTAGEPRFRYLRKYLESAHRRAGQPLTDEQVWALDVFDAIIDRFDLQFRTLLQEGEILITVDSQVLHARTAFADSRPGGPPDAAQAAEGRWRFFDRVWARKRV